ncbi:MAG: toxin Cry1Ac domain D-VI-related protein [Coprobacillaceae bacterium]
MGPAGTLDWDSASGYYVVNSGTGATYNHYLFYIDSDGKVVSNTSAVVDLNQGGLLDEEGNLNIGATLSDVQADGSIYLPNGGSFVTGDKTYIFGGDVTITGSEAATSDSYVIETHVNDNGNITIANEIIQVGVNSGLEVVVDLTKDGTTTLPAGTIVDMANGDKVYVVDGGSITKDGVITPNDVMITVPSGSVSSITTSGDQDTLPSGSTVTMNEETVSYPGIIIINTVENTVIYLPVSELLNEDETDLGTGITQTDIDDARVFVDGMTDGALKDQLTEIIEKAQAMLDAKNAVEELLDKDGNLNSGVTQEDINNVQDLVNKLPNGQLKDELQAIIDEAQKQLDAKNVNVSNPSTSNPNGTGISTTTISSVSTGDYSNIILLIGMMMTSIIVIGFFNKKRRTLE